MSKLSSDEIQRYKRHLLLHDIGAQGQLRLKAARVLVVGAGGLGCPILLYLAAAGVGTIGIVDDDRVSLDNLQRQIAHTTARVGASKVSSAAESIRAINPHVNIETHEMRLTAANALGLVSRYDLVADGSDNFATRYVVSDACFVAEKPLVFGALGAFDGYVSTFKPYTHAPDGKRYPTYRCLFPEAPAAGTVPNCAEAGVLGAVAGVIATIQATEILKELTSTGTTLAGRLLIYDAKETRFETLTVPWDSENPLNGEHASLRPEAMAGATSADVVSCAIDAAKA